MSSAVPVQQTLVTRERVVAPPDRFVDVSDGELLSYFQSVYPKADKVPIAKLHEMIEGLCNSGFTRLRRQLEQDFTFFANAANATPGTDKRERDPSSAVAEIDAQEARFLANFMQLLEAGHYKLLTSPEWDAACAEEFLLTLPVKVNWDAMDDKLLPRALWASRPDLQAESPPQLADRVLIFHRGVDVAHISGQFLMRKVDLIISFFILQPIFQLFAWIMAKLGVKRFVPDAPSYMARPEDADAAIVNPDAKAEIKSTAAAIRSGDLHEASINIERRTFARTYPDGKSVMKQLFKKADLKEACFKDVIVVYRKAMPDAKVKGGEMDLIKEADPAFLQRNMVIKRFASIPIADLELVFPDKKVYMPPQVMVNMAISLIGALAAVITAIRGGVTFKVLWPTLTMLGTRAGQVYSTAMVQRTAIERAMQNLLYERTMASQSAVVSCLTEEMAKQRTRELLISYCVLVASTTPLTADQLDAKCEALLASQFGLKLDFTCEEALPTLQEWGLVNAPISVGSAPAVLVAVPLSEALVKVDAVWDALYDFTGGPGLVSTMADQPMKLLGSAFNAVRKVAPKSSSAASAAPASSTTKATPAAAAAAAPTRAPVTAAPVTPSSEKKKKGFFSRLSKS